MFLKFAHYELGISEVSRYGFLRRNSKRSYGWIQEKTSKQ
jgi:hypothetical protein